MPKPFQLIDSSITLHGITFSMAGARMDRFKANPVMLYMHKRGEVIGKWNNLTATETGYTATPEFDTEDEIGKLVAGKVERGFLKACSVGLIIHKLELVADTPTAIDWEPYECSIVDSGSNAHALVLYSPDGEVIANMEEHINNLTLSIMSEQKKPEAAPEIPAAAAGLKGIALAAGLAEDATETLVADRIAAILKENGELKLSAKAAETQRVKDLLDGAVADKRITATQRTHFETLAVQGFDSVKAIVDALPKPVDLAAFATNTTQVLMDFEGEEKLAIRYRELDKSGKLDALLKSNPAEFNKLYKACYGVDYK